MFHGLISFGPFSLRWFSPVGIPCLHIIHLASKNVPTYRLDLNSQSSLQGYSIPAIQFNYIFLDDLPGETQFRRDLVNYPFPTN